MRDWVFPMDLQLFAEGAAGGEGSGAAAPAAGGQTTGVKGNPLAGVKYGAAKENAPAAGEQPETTQEAPPDRHAEFEKLIKGDYKDAYDKRVQDTVQKRLKGMKELEARNESMNPLLEILSAKYGVEPADIEGLVKAVEKDDELLESAAMEKGMDVKTYREFTRMKAENARIRAMEANRTRQDQLNQQYAQWEQQAAQARQLYPNLDLNVESENPQFRQLLLAGVDVGSAYMVIHKDDIMAGALQQGAQKGRQMLANTIAAGQARPAENGASGQGSASTKFDPANSTREQRREWARRAARGERIEL